MNYNRKLHKLNNNFKHAKLIKATTNRELFPRQGLHMNKKWKEIMTSEIDR
jgi:hypothetical protein